MTEINFRVECARIIRSLRAVHRLYCPRRCLVEKAAAAPMFVYDGDAIERGTLDYLFEIGTSVTVETGAKECHDDYSDSGTWFTSINYVLQTDEEYYYDLLRVYNQHCL